VFLRRLGDVSPFPGELFVKRYGISPAECRVLMMLTQGMTVRETSAALGISEPTAKTHLQKLFQKTDTERQAGRSAFKNRHRQAGLSGPKGAKGGHQPFLSS
jgi:DNA-binding CsgD family transcriptional regulator